MTEATNDPYAIIRRLYHFTDKRNVRSIRENGGILSLRSLEAANLTIPAPGGDETSQATDRAKGMDRYVHLCLHHSHPMDYVAKKSGRLNETIFLEIDRKILYLEGVRFVPGMANTHGIQDCILSDAASAGMLADIETLYRWISWAIFPDARQRRVRAEKFEILVPDVVPLDLILNLPNG